jgi:hypothetical protein
VVGGIGYGERSKPTYETETFGLESVSGVTIESRKPKKKAESYFGEDVPLTRSESESKEIIKFEKKRLREILKADRLAAQKSKSAKTRRAKSWKKKTTYKFNRSSPLAKKLRKLF